MRNLLNTFSGPVNFLELINFRAARTSLIKLVSEKPIGGKTRLAKTSLLNVL